MNPDMLQGQIVDLSILSVKNAIDYLLVSYKYHQERYNVKVCFHCLLHQKQINPALLIAAL